MNVWMGYQSNPSGGDLSAGYQKFTKTSDINGHSASTGQIFGPSTAMVFIDEKDTSIDDGEFLVQETVTANIANLPASYHNGAGEVTFADGHVELHKWITPLVAPQIQPSGVVSWPPGAKENFVPCGYQNADLVWMQKVASYSPQ
jgi:prepilin-type processing-associated H-X9-DG protein